MPLQNRQGREKNAGSLFFVRFSMDNRFSMDLVRGVNARASVERAPSVTRVVICVSRAFARRTKKKERLLVVY